LFFRLTTVVIIGAVVLFIFHLVTSAFIKRNSLVVLSGRPFYLSLDLV